MVRLTLTKPMVAELAAKNIRVNVINPVIGETGLKEKFMGLSDTPENLAKYVSGNPVLRFSHPNNITNMAFFVADPSSVFITSVAIEVDGRRCI